MENPLAAMAISILILLISTAFGRRLLALAGVKSDSPVESSVFGAGLGLGALAYLVLAVGLMGLLHAWAVLAVLGIMAIISLGEIGRLIFAISRGLKSRAGERLTAIRALIAFPMIAVGALTVIAALAPPAELDWDGLAYHLAVPKIYLAKQSIHYIPFMSHSNFPFLVEMLYTVGLSLGSVSIAKLFHFWMFIATAAAIYSLCRRHLNARTGSLAALLFMTVPVIIWEAGIAYADIGTALYVTLGVYAILNWRQSRNVSWLIVGGLAMGFALGTKVLAAVPLAVLCLWALWASRNLKPALTIGVIAILVGAPWYVKSFVYTGNPFYPFLYNIFGGRFWSAEAAEAYRGAQLVFGMGRSLGDLIILPWNATMNGALFFDDPDPARPKLFSLIGPAFLGLIPLTVLAKGGCRRLVGMAAVVGVFGIAWFVLMQQIRYMIPIIPLLAIMAAAGLYAANEHWRFGRHVANAFTAVAIASGMIVALILAIMAAPAVFGIQDREDFLAENLDVYRAQAYVNDSTPEDAKIVLFEEVRGFYLDREYIWGNPGHHEMTPWQDFRNAEDMIGYFKEVGFSHALINWKYAGQAGLMHNLIAESIGKGLMREVYGSNLVSVYEFHTDED